MTTAQTRVTHRGWVTAALLMSMFMTAIEITIVATAMPRIVADLGGFALLSWVFSSYLLTQVVSIPIYGKLADLYGRKPVFLCGVIVFLLASILCGQARTMLQLIAFRFLQGIGGGAVQPIAVTIIGDLFQPHERHKIQGLTGSVFAISSLVGPTLGAFIVDWGHWSWIFYLNVPLGLIAILLLSLNFHEEKRVRQHKIDFGGAFLLVTGTTALMIGLLEGGTAWDWISWQSFTCFATFLILGASLLKLESKVREPILPLWIFKHPLISIAGVATFLNGAMMIGYSAMVPTHVQGVLGRSALVAGLTLAAMSIGWPLASYFSGKAMIKYGYRKVAILGAVSLLVGALGVLASAQFSPVAIAAAIFLTGVGLGLQSNAYIVTIQSTVPWKERGVATSNNLFMRTLGSSVGVAAFGGILNSTITRHLGQLDASVSGVGAAALSGGADAAAASGGGGVGHGGGGGHGLDLVNKLLGSSDGALDPSARSHVIDALASGMHAVFVMAAVIAFVALLATFFLPSEVEARS